MEPNPTSPMVPAVQKPTSVNSNSMVNMLSQALNPASAQALATVEQNIQPPTPPPALDLTPEPTKEVAIPAADTATTTENKPLKKGFDALEPETQKTEDATTEDEVFPPEVDTPEKKSAWSGIQKDVRALRKEKAAWEAEKTKLATEAAKARQFTEADPEWKEYQKAKSRLAEVEPVIARVAYTKTPAYKEAVEIPRNDLGVQAKAMAEQFKITDTKMIAALTETDPQRQSELLEEVSESMDSRSKARLFRMADDLESLAKLDERMAANAEAAYKEADAIEAQKREQSTIERKAAEMRSVTDSRDKLMKVASALKTSGETDEQAIQAILDSANSTPFSEHSTEDAAFAVIAAQLVPRLMQNLRATQAALAAKEQYIAQMAASNPRAAQGQQGQPNGNQVPADMMSGIRAQLSQLGITR